jgi:ketosteroid isomerase-like protein
MQHHPHEQDSKWTAFMRQLEAAEAAFVQGRPEAFKALWSHADDATICGGYGGKIEVGWQNVSARLDWASSKYSDGTRTRQELGASVSDNFAYLVQIETLEYRVAGTARRTTQQLRVTMVFRREPEGWRIVHRHADAQTRAQLPEEDGRSA